METFIALQRPVENPHYHMQRQKCISQLTDNMIDAPIINLVHAFNELPYCFTMQSCYGHFICNGQNASHNLEPLPAKDSFDKVAYRIAYIAFCIENNLSGKQIFESFKEIPAIDPKYVQFCCAEWFWKRQVNSYVLQVEPARFKHKDTAIIDFNEASYIETIRNVFFMRLHALLENAKKM